MQFLAKCAESPIGGQHQLQSALAGELRTEHRAAGEAVFKLTRRRLKPGQLTTITRRHRFAHTSIRRILQGRIASIR